MLTLQDCIELSELSEDEVLAIAQHEHIPHIAAAELGNYLVHTQAGEVCVKDMMREDIAAATARDDRLRVIALKLVLRDYIGRHPSCEARRHAREQG